MSNYIIIFVSTYLLLQPLFGNAATISEVQKMLHNLGYSIGKADGRWGSKSREALKRFQAKHGLPVTGNTDTATEQALQMGVNAKTTKMAVSEPKTLPVEEVKPATAIETIVLPSPVSTAPAPKLLLNKDKIIESPAGIKFVRVPGGCFTMGGGNFGNKDVCIHKGNSFLIGQYEVTQEQWRSISGSNPSIHALGVDYPVENVSWNEVHQFIEKLNKQGQGNYRLPTEAEWEYSTRANTKTMYWWGDKPPTCEPGHPNSANFNGDKNCPNAIVKVGMYQPNEFGLYDVHGNVWELVEDIYLSDAYTRYQQDNPVITEGGTERVFRGGSWLYPASAMTAFNRDHAAPNFQFSHLGFRLIYEPKE